MIHLVICKWRVNGKWLSSLAEAHQRKFPNPIQEYPETFLLRGQIADWCRNWAQGMGTTIITDNDHIINEFRCMVKEGDLNDLKMTEVCSEDEGYFLLDYYIDRDGRFDTFPTMLDTHRNQLSRLM